MSPRQGSPVPRELLPPHIGRCQLSATSIFQLPLSCRTTTSSQHARPSGVLRRRSDGLDALPDDLPRPVAQYRQFPEEAKDASVSECTWTLSALEALRNALYKFKTYLLTYLLTYLSLQQLSFLLHYVVPESNDYHRSRHHFSCSHKTIVKKKLSYSWHSSCYGKISHSGRSTNANCDPMRDLCKFYFTLFHYSR